MSRWGMVLGLVVVACSSPQARPPQELAGYVWLERIPARDTDIVNGMFVAQRQAMGAFFKGSAYVHHAERFVAMREGDRLRLQFPQSGKQAQLTFKIESCDNPEPFENVCLVLSQNPWGGPTRFRGIKLDEARKRAELRAVVELD